MGRMEEPVTREAQKGLVDSLESRLRDAELTDTENLCNINLAVCWEAEDILPKDIGAALCFKVPEHENWFITKTAELVYRQSNEFKLFEATEESRSLAVALSNNQIGKEQMSEIVHSATSSASIAQKCGITKESKHIEIDGHAIEMYLIGDANEASGSNAIARKSMDDVHMNDSNWQEALLSKLKEPDAAPIVLDIKKFVKLMCSESLKADSKTRIAQRFYREMPNRIVANAIWKDCSAVEIDQTLEAIEKYTFNRAYAHVFSPTDTDDSHRDHMLSSKISKLQQLSSTAFLEGQMTGKQLQEKDLEKIAAVLTPDIVLVDESKEPSAKIMAIVNYCKHVAELMEQEHAGSGADSLLPVMVYVIVRVNPARLISNIRFIQRFRNHAKLAGESAYCLTNMVAIISTIEQLGESNTVSSSDARAIYQMVETRSSESVSSEMLSPLPRPFAELNTMATTMFNKITFVPRAIGGAVADTFRSRATRTSPQASAELSEKGNGLLQAFTAPQLAKPSAEILALRRHMAECADLTQLTLMEIQKALVDYQGFCRNSLNE